jgi:hypothetical protein
MKAKGMSGWRTAFALPVIGVGLQMFGERLLKRERVENGSWSWLRGWIM